MSSLATLSIRILASYLGRKLCTLDTFDLYRQTTDYLVPFHQLTSHISPGHLSGLLLVLMSSSLSAS